MGEKWGSGLVRGLKSVERLKKAINGHKNNNNTQKTFWVGGYRVFGHSKYFWTFKIFLATKYFISTLKYSLSAFEDKTDS